MIILSTSNLALPKSTPAPDLYELRLDLCDTYRDKLYQIKDKKPIIMTLRDKNEGGFYQSSIEEKIDVYTDLLLSTNHIIDIEYQHLSKLLKKNKKYLKRIIISYHDFSGDYTQYLNEIDFSHDCFFYKIVLQINSYKELLEVNGYLKKKTHNYTLISTGETSLLSRVLYKQIGLVATYYCLKGDETAVNQLNSEEAIWYNLKNIDYETKIGGIIGGNQVKQSLGLKFYNSHFKSKNINAVYLPFNTNCLDDLIYFIKESKLNFYGFSVTMPYKSTFAKMLGLEDKVINLWLNKTNQTYLTDEEAFKKAFEILATSRENFEVILLIGNGAMSKTVHNLLPQHKIINIGRSDFNTPISTNKKTLLINATPIGSRGEDLLEIIDIKNFDYVIDLPYNADTKTKLKEYCVKYKVPIIDGHEFWELQAESQLQLFISEINR
jgi:3-dehydroquinate dehydratase-1